jgi:hypothetical protein
MRALLLLALAASCADPPPKKNPFEPPPRPAATATPIEPARPTGPPQFRVGAEGPKIGWQEVLIDKPDGRERLKAAIGEQKSWIEGKKVPLFVDRKARLPWVVAMLEELASAGATGFTLSTETRKEYKPSLDFLPAGKVDSPPACAVVGMILADYKAAIWTLGGGVAGRSPKGMAGPDLTVAAEIVERKARACQSSRLFSLSAAENIDWGLAYDLAATAASIADPPLDSFVLLSRTPVAGRKVEP